MRARASLSCCRFEHAPDRRIVGTRGLGRRIARAVLVGHLPVRSHHQRGKAGCLREHCASHGRGEPEGTGHLRVREVLECRSQAVPAPRDIQGRQRCARALQRPGGEGLVPKLLGTASLGGFEVYGDPGPKVTEMVAGFGAESSAQRGGLRGVTLPGVCPPVPQKAIVEVVGGVGADVGGQRGYQHMRLQRSLGDGSRDTLRVAREEAADIDLIIVVRVQACSNDSST